MAAWEGSMQIAIQGIGLSSHKNRPERGDFQAFRCCAGAVPGIRAERARCLPAYFFFGSAGMLLKGVVGAAGFLSCFGFLASRLLRN